MYKLIGPALIKQDPVEARSNVGKRLEFIHGELGRLDSRLKALEKQAADRQQKVLGCSLLSLSDVLTREQSGSFESRL